MRRKKRRIYSGPQGPQTKIIIPPFMKATYQPPNMIQETLGQTVLVWTYPNRGALLRAWRGLLKWGKEACCEGFLHGPQALWPFIDQARYLRPEDRKTDHAT